MGGSSELEIVVRGDETEVMEVLSTLEYAQRVDKGETPEPGCVKVNIITDKGVDVREQVFYKLAAANLPIMFMAKMEKSLEDIFLELTGKGGSINDCNL